MRVVAKGGFFLKRVLIFALALATVISLAACSDDSKISDGKIRTIDQNAPAHQQLLIEAGNLLVTARQAADAGVTLQAEYIYGMAQASVSSLRYAVDTILWLKGEGETIADIVGYAPYGSWDDIASVSLGSPSPFYFEGLLFSIQGKDTEAEICYEKARANPAYVERDFYYLRNFSVEELYALRGEMLEIELAIAEEYTPRTVLCVSPRTGAEFSPGYHLTIAGDAMEDGDIEKALQSAVNALISDPTAPEGYRVTVALALESSQTEDALFYLNEGLWVFPEDGALNYLAAAVSLADGDREAARQYLNTAKGSADQNLLTRIIALEAQIGG